MSTRWVLSLSASIHTTHNVNVRDAVALLSGAIPRRGGIWADLGAGEGTFTRALADLLGPEGRVYAVDRDAGALQTLERWALREAPNIISVRADFTAPLELPGLGADLLDGLLLANALHFVEDAAGTLARLAAMVRAGGRAVVIEYDRRAASPWVPFPISPARLAGMVAQAGLAPPTITSTRRSRYGGDLYVAVAERS